MSSFLLFSRDSPLASSLVFGLGLVLALGNGWGLGFGLGLVLANDFTTKGLYFFLPFFFYINMSKFSKFKTNSYCVGGRHYSGTNKIRGVVTATGTKMLKGSCAMCRRNKSMTVSDATKEAEGLKNFFKSVGKATVNFGKKVAYIPVRALEIASKIETHELLYQPHLI